ncbi:hypothetical protein GSI_02110 [Ganoderma sinense ZZ0214-1]|uniref:Uncharacterized protein n=1 Tax=Ganoderma sinense ZZ0214-1 TaxID=1077348 RepID=A0A2G8SNN9_9APHY|nr:hypothetical protein GSI_02110 [Ganoderma sinense ZZ0214-1]
MPSYQQRLDSLAARIAKFDNSREHDRFVELLKDVATVVREADATGAPDLSDIVEKAGGIYDSAINWAYGDGDFDFLPSYAHAPDAPPVEDPLHRFGIGSGAAVDLLRILSMMYQERGSAPIPRQEFIPDPWTQSHRPHPKSTRISRFHDNVVPSVTNATPFARTIYDARCEVTSDTIACPVTAAIASDSSVLAIAGQGGWKHRDPVLSLYLLDEGSTNPAAGGDDDNADSYQKPLWRFMGMEPGLSEVAYQIALDTPHKLALVADSQRIKTFYWGRANEVQFKGWAPSRGINVHTLDSGRYSGPVAVLPDGRIARAGKGGFALWSVEELATHRGGKRVGRGKFSTEGSLRDNDMDEIERSVGSSPTTTVKFAKGDEAFAPATWHLHEPSGRMIVGENGRESHTYGCYMIDLGEGGKKVTRFLGHGGNAIEEFSTSAGDPNVFATACADGYARLYDIRHPLPVLTIDAGKRSEFCTSVQFVHPDGIPTLFTGSDRSQSVRCWDVRARAVVYELGTGNNRVCALNWDAKRSALYATTECDYMDRNGYTHDYRHARIPRWARLDPEDRADDRDADMEDEDDEYDQDDDEYDSLDDDDDEHNWPKSAYHNESFFGYAYDAGEHVLLRYGFKEDPDISELPEYGQASLDNDGYW